MKVRFFAWAVFVALALSLAPAVTRSDQPPRPVNAAPADAKASLSSPLLQAGVPVNDADPLGNQLAAGQAALPGPALAAPPLAAAQSIHAWQQRWVVAVVLVGGALAILGLELVRRLERGYLDSV